MIREEKIKRLKALKARCERLIVSSDRGPEEWRKDAEALDLALTALRPITREQVEKAEWIWSTGDVYICSSCGEKTHVDECMGTPIYNFCPFCMAPMTDEAVEMVMERLEALEDG